jgi:uncharacterized protein (DUF1800 family)
MNRRDFFKGAKPKVTYAPHRVNSIRQVESGLETYDGAWTMNEVAHLLKRTMFGATKPDIDHFLAMNVNDAVDELLNTTKTVSPPVRDYGLIVNDEGTFDDVGVVQGQTWVHDLTKQNENADATINGLRVESLRKWWVGLMVHQGRSIVEKMVLFWHHHFSIQREEVMDATMIWRHHELLRNNVLGNLRQLTKEVTIDPAMLYHLNGYLNSKVAPDENYARELQELFTVGKGNDSLYTEDDVIAAARVLTGWRVNDDTKTSFLDPASHDTENKSFSAFYNNTTISGSANAAQEIDQFIDMIYATQESSKYFCRKLYRWFIYSEIDDQTEINVIAPLATILRENNFEVKPVLSALFKSAHFFDQVNMACYIKNPFDFIVGTLREFNTAFPAYSDYQNGYPVFKSLYLQAAQMQQDLFQPPDVSGWPAYHQEPMFYDLWVNSNSLPYRANFADSMIMDNLVDLKSFAQYSSDPSDPDQLVEDVTALLLRYPLSANSKLYIKNSFLLNNTGDNNVWTNAWNNSSSMILPSLKNMFLLITNLPEFHLC